MEVWQVVLTVLGSVAASSGMWAFLQTKVERRSATTQLLLGLAHDRIIDLGMTYLERGWITKDEYDDLNHYLWKPYSKFGGNGLADKVKRDVDNLPIYGTSMGPVKIVGPKKEKKHGDRTASPDEGNGNE